MKEKLRPNQNSNAVYLIPCKQCGKCYIGETSWSVFERCSQHKKDVRYIDKQPNKTALVSQVNNTKHEFDFDGVKILKKVRTKGLLKIHEANQIILHEEVAGNFKKDAKHVSPIVYNLIKKMENDKTKKTIKQVKRNFQESVSTGYYPETHKIFKRQVNIPLNYYG